MNPILIYILTSLVGVTAIAKPKESPTPQQVCNSIDSNKYKAQCEQALYKAKYFQPSAIIVCGKIKFDYEKKSCMEVIRNKFFTKKSIEKCINDEKLKIGVPLNKCLQNQSLDYRPDSKTMDKDSGAE